MRTRFIHWSILLACLVLCGFSRGLTHGAVKTFSVGGASVTLEEAANDIEVRFRSMRLNRVSNVWNVEISISNKSTRSFSGPFIVLVETNSGISGVLAPDGFDNSSPPKPFFNLSSRIAAGRLLAGEVSGERTLSLGVSSGVPKLTTKAFVTPERVLALAMTRTLDENGLPLGGTEIFEVAPDQQTTLLTDASFATATLGGKPGLYHWKFSASGYLPVWRRGQLDSEGVALISGPRLTRRHETNVTFSGNSAGILSNQTGTILISVPSTAFSGTATATLTPLTPQTLPALLPAGWSPLQAFWLEWDREPATALQADLVLIGALRTGDSAALVRWDTNSLDWRMLQIVAGPASIARALPIQGSGAYAVVVADTGTGLSPPQPQVGQAISGSTSPPVDYALLSAEGSVIPATSPASRIAEQVTADARVVITNAVRGLPSGLILRCEVQEEYLLQNGNRHRSAPYENFIIGYQRPGDENPFTLDAAFRLRPQLLLDVEDLFKGVVQVDVLPPSAFAGGVMDTNGGELMISTNARLIIARGEIQTAQAAVVRSLNPADFSGLESSNLVFGFELTMGGVVPGRRIAFQMDGLQTNTHFVLARVISRDGVFGLEPVERLLTGTNGGLTSLEPGATPRLQGLIRSGQYFLVQVSREHGVISGTTLNSGGTPVGGLLVRVVNQPWATFSETNGFYQLLASLGSADVTVVNRRTGDSGFEGVVLDRAGRTVDLRAESVGPRVVSSFPAAGSVNVARVTPIVIGFNEPINPGSIGLDGIQVLDTNGQPVAASLSLNMRSTIATLLPINPLAPSAQYLIRVSTNLSDPTGLRLEGSNIFAFATESDHLNRGPARVESYEPTNGVAYLTGSAGIAEAEAPVILVNETSGRTVTVLSKVDGSFSNSISATVDDFLSAVIVNRNGTRNTIPVSRQNFRDGSVGLFQGGGILEAQSDGGPVQVLVEPGAIETRAKFKLQPVPRAQVMALLSNLPPELGRVLGGFRFSADDSIVKTAPDISFPVSAAELGLPPGNNPTNATYALTAVREIDGVKVYEILDRMQFEDGKLATHSLPFLGLFGAFEDILIAPLLLSVGSSMTIAGSVMAGVVNTNGVVEEGTKRFLPGAVVTIDPMTGASQAGRLRAGAYVAVARGTNAWFSTMVPVNSFDPLAGAAALRATHPRYPGKSARRIVQLPTVEERLAMGNILAPAHLNFPLSAADLVDLTAPRITIGHEPLHIPAGSTASVRVVVFDDFSGPWIQFDFDGPATSAAGSSIIPSDVQIEADGVEVVAANIRRAHYRVTSSREGKAVVRVRSADDAGNLAEMLYTIRFGGTNDVVPNVIPNADSNDITGPQVIYSSPARRATGLAPGQPVRLKFSEPIDRSILQNPGFIYQQPFTSIPVLRLSEDQEELLVYFPDLRPDTEYTLVVTANLTDLRSNPLDQDPTTPAREVFSLNYRTAARGDGILPGIQHGGGVVSKGIYSYALERRAQSTAVVIFDASNPAEPQRVAEIGVPGTARDLVLIPRYAYRRGDNAPIETNDLLAVVGGDIGSAVGQFLWVINVSNPVLPQRLASRQISLAPSSAVLKVVWTPPMLAYLELGDPSSIGLVNLQAFILGEEFKSKVIGVDLFWPSDGTAGSDLNGDGDFVDANEVLPYPRARGDFGGKVFTYTLPDTDQGIMDFAIDDGGAFVGVIVDRGEVLGTNGLPTGEVALPAYRTLFSGLLELPRQASSMVFSNSRPTRVTTIFNFELPINGQMQSRDLALVSVTMDGGTNNRLAVVDITLPTDPRLLTEIPIPVSSGFPPYSIQRREDGMLLLATPKDVLLIDPSKLMDALQPGQEHPAIVGLLPDVGSGSHSFSSSLSGLHYVNQGGKNRLLQTAPLLEVVSFPSLAPFVPTNWAGLDEEALREKLSALEIPDFLAPSRFRTADCASSSVNPPIAAFHYYALIQAPGSAGKVLDLGLESLNWAQQPLRPKGFLFPPVHAFAAPTLEKLAQLPGVEDAPVRSSSAWRLSDDPASEFYNYYLSRPFVLIYEELTTNELASIQGVLDRDILWSGDFLRLTLDPVVRTNGAVGRFAGEVDILRREHRPGTSVEVPSFPADYLQSPNPGPVAGFSMLPGTMNAVAAHSAELVINTVDLELPGRRIQLSFTRNYSGQGVFDGPFGRGWDFNFNQRLVEVGPGMLPHGARIPLVMSSGAEEDECASGGDLLFYTGAGRVMVYAYAGTNAPPEYANDPLVQRAGWISKTARFYRTPSGAFNLVFKFQDQRFLRLEPDGTQYWYNPSGRLIKVYDRFEKNAMELFYNVRGELIRIRDDSGRPLEIGYWRLPNDPDHRPGIDEVTPAPAVAHKISRLLDYSRRDVLFYYTQDGLLERREGPKVETVASNSFLGRQITRYLYSDSSNPLRSGKALIGVVGGELGGSPLVSVNAMGNKGRDTVNAFSMAGDVAAITLSHSNSAAALSDGPAQTSVSGPAGSTLTLQFDTQGRARESVMNGPGLPPLTNRSEYYTNGLLKSVTHPEGNTVEYSYDHTNASLRARANLVRILKRPGPRGGPLLEASTSFDNFYNLPAGERRDFNGNLISIQLSSDRRETVAITRGPLTETYEVNEFGQMIRHVSPDGVETLSFYNGSGFLSERRVHTNATFYSYGNLTGLTSDPGLRGLASEVTDPRGVVTRQIYDEKNQLVRETRAGTERTFAYDTAGHPVLLTTRMDTNRVLVESRTYNQMAFMTSRTFHQVETGNGLADLTTTYVPDAHQRLREIIAPGGERYLLNYDNLGRQIETTLPGVFTEHYGYDGNGNRISKTIGSATELYTLDGHDRLIRHRSPAGTTVHLELDGNDNITRRTILDGQSNLLSQTSYTVDNLDRYRSVIRRRDNGFSTNRYDFDETNRTVTVTDALGARAISYFDRAGRVERVLTPTLTNLFRYDGGGSLIEKNWVENEVPYRESFIFNERQQQIRETDNLNQFSERVVGLDGRIHAQIDREGHASQTAFTLLGEKSEIVTPNQVRTKRLYANNREVAEVHDTATNISRTIFDSSGRPAASFLPNGAVTLYTNYNEMSLPRTLVMPRGVRLQISYDLEGKVTNRLISGLGPTRQELYEYDGLQRPTRIVDPSGEIRFVYDLFGFTRQVQRLYQFQTNPPSTASLAFQTSQEADAAGFRATFTYPFSSVTVTNGRDLTGRLVSMVPNGGGTLISTSFYAGDKLIGSRTLGNNLIRFEQQFDLLKRAVARRYVQSSNGAVLLDLRYQFDRNGAVLARQQLQRAGRTDFFRYDPGYRLIRADLDSRPSLGSAESGRLLPGYAKPVPVAGNWAPGRLARNAAYRDTDVLQAVTLVNPDLLPAAPMAGNFGVPDALLHVSELDGFNRTRDEIGNVTRTRLAVRLPGAVEPSLVGANLFYNDLKQLIRVERDDGVMVWNEYDQSGLRIRRRVNGSPALCVPRDVAYLYDGGRLLEERDLEGDAAVLARYFYADEGDDLLAVDLMESPGTNLVRHFVLSDALKSVLGLVDGSGRVVERIQYDPWGGATFLGPDQQAPRISRMYQQTNSLVLEFSEPVLPVFAGAPPPSGLVAGVFDIQGLCTVRLAGRAVPGRIVHEESLPGYGFGTVYRFIPGEILSGNVEVSVAAGALQDENGLVNPAEMVAVELNGSGALFSGPAPGSTAAVKMGRSATGNRLAFHGQYLDEETGLLYCRSRFYDPYSGMFLQMDPAGYVDGVNQYAGFANNPVNFRDPLGSSIRDVGRTLVQTGSEMSYQEHGLIQGLFGGLLTSVGSVLMIGSSAGDGMELLESNQQGTLGLRDRLRGAEILANDARAIFGLSGSFAALGQSVNFRAHDFASRLSEKRAAVRTSRQRSSAFLRGKGLSDLEPDAFYRAMEQFKKEMGATTVEVGIRDFGHKAQARRRNSDGGMLNKGVSMKGKASDKAIAVQEEPIYFIDGKRAVADKQKQFTSDTDLFYVKVDGKTVNLAQSQRFGFLVNREYSKAWKAAGRQGAPNVPVLHGAHVNLPELYGSDYNDKLINNEFLKDVGHPGDAFSIRLNGDGSVSSFQANRGYLQGMLSEADEKLLLYQLSNPLKVDSFGLPDNWHGFK